MIKIDRNGCKPFADETLYNEYVEKALAGFDTLEGGEGAGNDFLGWNALPSSITDELMSEYKEVVANWKAKGIDLVVVIGIGGSYLGAKAALEALGHTFIAKSDAPQIVFAGNNLSEDYIAELFDLMATKNVATVCISKSGTTTEPAIAFRLIKSYVEERYGKAEACERIVAVTDKARGALKTLSNAEGYKTFVIEDNIGGRFSVLTPVGLLPIALAGYDIDAMVAGAKAMEELCAKRCPECNPAIQYAAIRNMIYQGLGKGTEILVNFNPKLQYVAEWWKQLYGESEGKDGKGIFPASVGYTTDLHSMGQYVQDGVRNLFETVITVEQAQRVVTILNDDSNLDGLNFLTGKRVEECNNFAMLGTKLAHIDGGVPQIGITIEKINEYNLGELFYFFEKACGISGYMLGVNPFNQPGVEDYKKNMFALLGKPGYEALAAELAKRL